MALAQCEQILSGPHIHRVHARLGSDFDLWKVCLHPPGKGTRCRPAHDPEIPLATLAEDAIGGAVKAVEIQLMLNEDEGDDAGSRRRQGCRG